MCFETTMFMHQTEEVPDQLDEEFSRPVESIMRCEDFKSNFARKLSNRYSSRSALTKRQNSVRVQIPSKETVDNAPERIEQCSQLSKINTTEQNGEVVLPPNKPMKNHSMRDTEVTALNMAIETLRWQLAQTEANRQMHIALLKQVVSFLSRVKEHIECQNADAGQNKDVVSLREVSSSEHSIVDLPRSRSVLHVNKHEYSLTTGKKLSTRKISKSISNVNGFKDGSSVWNQSKLSLSSEMDSSQKITEEISRLITLANTVLSTKIPDLSYSCNDSTELLKSDNICRDETLELNESNPPLSLDDTTNAFIFNTIYDSEDAFNGLTNKFGDVKDGPLTDFMMSSSTLTCGLENTFSSISINQKDENIKTQTETKTRTIDKRNEYNHVANFIEDESGFSSMSSFQEIGIPIISIIPPTPCKEVGYIDELTDILDGGEKWKNDAMDLDKQTVKVFWV